VIAKLNFQHHYINVPRNRFKSIQSRRVSIHSHDTLMLVQRRFKSNRPITDLVLKKQFLWIVRNITYSDE